MVYALQHPVRRLSREERVSDADHQGAQAEKVLAFPEDCAGTVVSVCSLDPVEETGFLLAFVLYEAYALPSSFDWTYMNQCTKRTREEHGNQAGRRREGKKSTQKTESDTPQELKLCGFSLVQGLRRSYCAGH